MKIDREALAALHSRGASAKEIATELNIGLSTAHAILRELGLTHNEPKGVQGVVQDDPFVEPYWTPPEPERDKIEDQVLAIVCKEGKAHSAVMLAADLYGTTEDVQESRPLEWTFVELILEDLNKKGLVTYRLGEGDLLVHIRPTRLGYTYLGIARHWVNVSNFGSHYSSKDEMPVHMGDTTDFRMHGETAVGMGPIVKEDFIDHCSDCDHLSKHLAQLREMYGSDKL